MSKRTTVHAYYYSFELTGVEHIDAILRLVARAGQGSPNTEFWDDPTVLEEGEPTYVERIQNAADKAAAACTCRDSKTHPEVVCKHETRVRLNMEGRTT